MERLFVWLFVFLVSFCGCFQHHHDTLARQKEEDMATAEKQQPLPLLLASDAARTSLKRTRELFDRTAHAAYVPSVVDASLHDMAVARRLRTQYNQRTDKDNDHNKKKNEGAMVVAVSTVHENDDETNANNNNNNQSTTSTLSSKASSSVSDVLARWQEQHEQEEEKRKSSTGILVVSTLPMDTFCFFLPSVCLVSHPSSFCVCIEEKGRGHVDTHTAMARSLEIVNGLVVSFGLGAERGVGPVQ